MDTDPDLALWVEGDRRIRVLLTDPTVQEYVNLLNRVQPPIAARSETARLHRTLSIMSSGLDRSLVAGDVSEV